MNIQDFLKRKGIENKIVDYNINNEPLTPSYIIEEWEKYKADNGKSWFNSYQEVDLFLFQEIDDFPIINEETPEANTIEAIKTYAKLHAEAYAEKYHQENMKEAIKLLSVARCPNGNCDNNGTIAYQTQSGDCELEPCQWCHDKQHLTN